MGLTPLKMPQLGESVTEGTVDRWLKQEGELVRRDEPIVEVVTDKVNAEIPSPFEGRLVRIQVPEGETVAIGTILAQVEVEGAADAAAAETPAEPATPTPAPTPAAAPAPAAPAAPAGDGRRLSPAVRRLAEEHGLDLGSLSGSGAGGRVTRDDVLAAVAKAEPSAPASAAAAPAAAASAPAAPAPAAPGGEDEELVRVSAVRRQIAEHMVRSVATSPHAWALREVDMTRLVEYRAAQKDDFQARHGFALSYLPFFIQIVCQALAENPYLNATWTDAGIVLKRHVNMGIAVALPDTLIVPVIKRAEERGFADLAWAVNDLATRARSKTLRPEDVQGGTFTLNNTGAIGSVMGQSIINQPQAAILSTEGIKDRPVVVDRTIVIRPIMYMTMSFDHRIVDGLAAGRFLNAVQSRIENWTPASLLL
jgi:2-oxoisovalerate dehydrogenase E2 component (dihydrolipoyl transacylase)